jgi:hypothetical protein
MVRLAFGSIAAGYVLAITIVFLYEASTLAPPLLLLPKAKRTI